MIYFHENGFLRNNQLDRIY